MIIIRQVKKVKCQRPMSLVADAGAKENNGGFREDSDMGQGKADFHHFQDSKQVQSLPIYPGTHLAMRCPFVMTGVLSWYILWGYRLLVSSLDLIGDESEGLFRETHTSQSMAQSHIGEKVTLVWSFSSSFYGTSQDRHICYCFNTPSHLKPPHSVKWLWVSRPGLQI